MLSSQEHAKLLDQLNHIPQSFIAQQRHNFQRVVKKKLKEHAYASKFSPFTPTHYEIVFVNRTTTIETLHKLINLVDRSILFTLDTESTNIRYQSNKPSLIQLQVIQSDDDSKILFVEVCHLPRNDQYTFTLIKQLFHILLQPGKTIFTWGELDELKEFTRYDLFTHDQINLPKSINVQTRFRTYWSDNYPHQETELSIDTSICKCLYCFGIQHDGLISIQDAVAITLNNWIDKRLTRYPFDIGLDPQLQRLNEKQLEFRQSMSTYAANDCDAVKQIIIYTNIINENQYLIEPQNSIFHIDEISPLNSPTNIFTVLLQEEQVQEQSSKDEIRPLSLELELEPVSEDDDIILSSTTTNRVVTVTTQPERQPSPESIPDERPQTSELTPTERKRIHNRSSTLRQRRRLFKHKITCYNIDPRFCIRKIKQMLDDNYINFTPVNTVKCRYTNKTILYIAVEDRQSVQQHQALIYTLFTTRNYNKIYRKNYNYPLNYHY